MKVAYFTELRTIVINEEPEPGPPGPREVLVRIRRVGVCGSDVHYYLEGKIGDQILPYPATLGHECAGTVVAVGSEVRDLVPGMDVAIDPAFSCGQCDQCRSGRPHTCRNLRFMGAPGEAPGAAAEFRLVPAENCFPVPQGLSLEEAVLAEPLSIALHAIRLGGVTPGMRVGVIGCGPIGLGILAVLRHAGAGPLYASEPLAYRREVAVALGCRKTIDPRRQNVRDSILEEEPRGLDVVFECSGDPDVIDVAQEILTPGGTLVIVGIPTQPLVSFNIHRMRRVELTFRNVRRQVGCMKPALTALALGHVPSKLFLTHVFPLGRIGEAFETVAQYADGVVKALVDLDSI